jgi:hypothetical protein
VRRLWLALLLLGCATGKVPRVPGDLPPAADDPQAEAAYQELLGRSTQHRGVYDNLDTRMFVYATWQSPAFVDARLKRWAAFRAIGPDELVKLKADEGARLKDATEFFVAVHANDWHYEDFDKKGSLWRLVLVTGGEELLPTSVERLGRPTVELRSLYSYLEPFWVAYRVRFPAAKSGSGQSMTFRLASPLGKADLPFAGE